MNEEEEFVDHWYKNYYSVINESAIDGSLSNKVLHKLIENRFKTNENFKILEVGANKGEHLGYVVDDYESYLITDIRKNPQLDISKFPRVEFRLADVTKLPFMENSFDRVISTCVFHHLSDPIMGLKELRRVAKSGSYISILLPNDPGIMYRALRAITTLRKAKSKRLLFEAQLIHALEHKNHYLGLRILIYWVFRKDKIFTAGFPFRFDLYNLNAITVFNIKKK